MHPQMIPLLISPCLLVGYIKHEVFIVEGLEGSTTYAQSPSGRICHVISLAPRTCTLVTKRIMLDINALGLRQCPS